MVISKIIITIGILLLTSSALLFFGVLLGLIDVESLSFLGHSGLRTIGSIAVAGCIMLSIGFWDN